ncbi:unnamed protein product, partial [Symbiodinium sp. KB8]
LSPAVLRQDVQQLQRSGLPHPMGLAFEARGAALPHRRLGPAVAPGALQPRILREQRAPDLHDNRQVRIFG